MRLKRLIVFITAAYAVGLIGYLLLRLIVGDGVWWLALLNNFAPYYFLPLVGLIPLMALVRQGRVAVVLLPLALIGALWVAPYYVPKARALSDGTPLHLVTFNMFPYNLRLRDIEAWLRETDADLVLLQEIHKDYYDADHIEQLTDLYPYQIAQPPQFPREDAIIEGLMVLSHVPVSVEDFTLDEGSGLVQQRITLELGGQTIAVYHLHLLMPIGETARISLPGLAFASQYDDSARNAQIMRLLERLQSERLPYLVAGDFNLSDQSLIYGKLTERLTDSFREAGIGFGASFPARASEELPTVFLPLLRLDYIWHSPQFRAITVAPGPVLGSDHLPLYATLELVKGS